MKKWNLNFLRRTQIVQSVSLLFVIAMLLSLVRISAILPGISDKADEEKDKAIQEKNLKEYTRGPIRDRNGETLAYSEKPMGKRNYTKPKEFGSLIGYTSRIYSNGGLEKKLNEYLVSSDCDRKGPKTGSTVNLTVDSGLQTMAFNAISGTTGAAVVLDAKTGEILALASAPSFNANKLDEKWEEYNQTEGIFTSNAYQNAVIPGSVFKVVTSAAILENGLEGTVVNDTGSMVVDGREIRNSGGTAYGNLTFEDAFVNSSNVYFMHQGLKMGADVLEQTMKDFLIGEKISLDFTDLNSNRDFGDYSDNMIATTAFGQGNTLITPLHMAMITQSIANDGKMLKPYVISSIVNGKGKTLLKGKKEVLTEPVSEDTAEQIRDAMVKAGEKYGIMELSGNEKIAAKTGTAQRGDGSNNAWMISFAPADDPEYVVCMNRQETDEYGISLKEEIEGIYRYLMEER